MLRPTNTGAETSALFERRFSEWQRYFLKKNLKDLGVVLLALTD